MGWFCCFTFFANRFRIEKWKDGYEELVLRSFVAENGILDFKMRETKEIGGEYDDRWTKSVMHTVDMKLFKKSVFSTGAKIIPKPTRAFLFRPGEPKQILGLFVRV